MVTVESLTESALAECLAVILEKMDQLIQNGESWGLIIRLGRPHGALFPSKAAPGGEYKRIASDHKTMAWVKDMTI
jgi:hypothetical protein